MKKLFFNLAVLFAVGSSQAAYLWWTVSEADKTTYSAKGAVSARVGYAPADGSVFVAGTALASAGLEAEDPYSSDGIAFDKIDSDGALKVDFSTLSTPENYSYYVELLNSSGGIVARSVVSGSDPASYSTYSSLVDGGYFATVGDDGSVTAPTDVWLGGGSFEAVPEPSSMVLLALGAGLVGLRRRLRKGRKAKEGSRA